MKDQHVLRCNDFTMNLGSQSVVAVGDIIRFGSRTGDYIVFKKSIEKCWTATYEEWMEMFPNSSDPKEDFDEEPTEYNTITWYVEELKIK